MTYKTKRLFKSYSVPVRSKLIAVWNGTVKDSTVLYRTVANPTAFWSNENAVYTFFMKLSDKYE